MLDSLFRTFDHLIVLDIETTGLDSRRDEIIEFAAFRLDKNQAIPAFDGELNMLVKLSAGRHLPQVITELTGISESQLADEGVTKATACEKISEWHRIYSAIARSSVDAIAIL